MEKKARIQHLQHIREYELQQALRFFPATGKVLEIGAGSGWQALLLKENGYKVTAIDILENQYINNQVFPVIIYDGFHLPFANHTFDIIFSSNVLEHISNLDIFESEMWRVLKSDGIAVHILPTTSWRLCTSLSHHLWVCRRIYEEYKNFSLRKKDIGNHPSHRKSPWYYLFWPNRHGASGNSFSELYFFSYRFWVRHFIIHGWQVYNQQESGIFYTGNQTFHNYISLKIRRKLAYFLGSSSRTYILKKPWPTI